MPLSFSVEGPDSEDLNSVFSRDDWGNDERVMLDAAFSSLAEVLGDEDDPLENIAVPRSAAAGDRAIAYAAGWSGKILYVNPVDFAGELEAAIDARGGLVDIGTVADTNLATAQAVATSQIQLDAISLYVSMYGTIGSFCPPRSTRAKAQHTCVLRPPEHGGAGCQLIRPCAGKPPSTWAEVPYA